MYCVVYNPYTLHSVLVDVNIPGVSTPYYAEQVAHRLAKKYGAGYTYRCEVPIVGEGNEKAYAGFTKYMGRYMLSALSSDASSLLQYLGANAIVTPLEKIVINTLEDAIALLNTLS